VWQVHLYASLPSTEYFDETRTVRPAPRACYSTTRSLPTALSTAALRHRIAHSSFWLIIARLRPQANCARLALEFQGYIVRTRALRKVLTPYAYSSVLSTPSALRLSFLGATA
jgi:hypothetical protein